ncbi:MAG: Cj0069 family protein [Xanthobacteraceae bacterium]
MDVESRSDSTNQSYATPGTLRATDAPNGYRVAILWRGDRETRRAATPHNNRYCRIFEELIALGIDAQPAVYADDYANEVRAQLLACDGVLVWVDPIHEGRTREVLDPMLRDVAARGPWVSAHPDVILKMGVKEVLHRTRHLGWGTDTHLYRTADDFRAGLPERLGLGPRVIKQNRGNGGQGVWKVEAAGGLRGAASLVTVLHARRGSVPETLRLNEFFARCEPYFAAGGCIIDQPFQARLPDGMIRCYMGADKVVGFGHQLIKALIPPPADGPDSPTAQPGPRIMHGAEALPFQALRAKMETEWTPQMMAALGIEAAALPIIWDADFLYGPPTSSGEDTYVLCEINVSSVFAIPDQAPAAIARLTLDRLKSKTGRGPHTPFGGAA